MDDSSRVRVGNAVAYFLEDRQQPRNREARDGVGVAIANVLEDVTQGAALDQLHRVVDRAVGGHADVVQRDNVRVLELPRDLRLRHEAVDGLIGGFLAVEHHLERDGANEVVILRLEHRAHAAGGDDALQSVKARASLRLRCERFAIAGAARREEVGDGDVTAAGFHLKRALELREQLFSGLALRADFALLFGLELNHCGTGFGLLRVHVT